MKIVSLAPSNTEILCALGAIDDIVAVTNLCDYPLVVRGKPKIGSWIATEPERLKEFSPDVIITSYFLPPPLRCWSRPDQLLHVEPKTLQDVYDSIITIGKMVHRQKEAIALVSEMKKQLSAIKKNLPKHRRTVYMEEWHKPPFISGNWIPELVAIAGGQEPLIQPGEPSRPVDLTELEAANPDIMICHWCGAGNKMNVSSVSQRPGWERLRAVQQRHIYAINDSLLNRPGPRLVEGARAIQIVCNTGDDHQ